VNTPVPDADTVYIDPLRQERSRKKARRDAVIGIASLLGFVVVIVLLVGRSSGWEAVQKTFFDGDQFVESFPGLLQAFWLNVRIFLIAEPLILIVGLLVALARTVKSPIFLPVRVLATLYVDIFRGVPTILIIFLLGFGMPALQLPGVPSDAIFWGTAALVLSYGAYVAEVFRAGIGSVHPSQTMAARSLGLSSFQTNRFVVLPQAVRNVTPPLLNDFVSLLKDTGLVSILGVTDAVRAAQINASRTFNYTPYVVAAILFLLITIPMTRYTDRAIRQRTNAQSSEGAI
jgi:polar amino acid transport system permease protein